MNPTNHLADQLRALLYTVVEWDMPGVCKVIQITSSEQGPANGMTVYVPANATLPEALESINIKRHQFWLASKPA